MNKTHILTLLLTRGIGRGTVEAVLKCSASETENLQEVRDRVAEAAKISRRIKVPEKAELETAHEQATHLIEQSANYGIKMISFHDTTFPERLRVIPNPPVLLHAKGNMECLGTEASVAIIGTRHPSDFGAKCGHRLGQAFAEQGLVVVSGLALGCDTAGHKGCLAGNGKTIAILAHGLDKVFPKENTDLAEQIIESEGLLLSEFPVGTPSRPHNFIDRDRLQSGLSQGVLVVETAEKGGTMHTVGFCLKQNRILACLKHPAQHWRYPSVGGNKTLIRDGKARPISDKDELAAFMTALKEAAAGQPPPLSGGRSTTRPTDPSQLSLFDDA